MRSRQVATSGATKAKRVGNVRSARSRHWRQAGRSKNERSTAGSTLSSGCRPSEKPFKLNRCYERVSGCVYNSVGCAFALAQQLASIVVKSSITATVSDRIAQHLSICSSISSCSSCSVNSSIVYLLSFFSRSGFARSAYAKDENAYKLDYCLQVLFFAFTTVAQARPRRSLLAPH